MFSERDIHWMRHAISLAEKAAHEQEVPVGALLVAEDTLIAEGWNRPIRECDPSAHAEVVTLRKAGQFLKNYRLNNTTLYVTLEPCVMCVGAIVQARIKRVVFGAFDTRMGAVQSAFQLGTTDKLNHRVHYEGGLLAVECAQLLSDFFLARRK